MKVLLLALNLLAVDPAVQDQLTQAEKELAAAKERVQTLRKQYYTLQITQITNRVDAFESNLPNLRQEPVAYRELLHQQLPTLFDKERAQLALIIDEEPSLAPAAQKELDRILALLTQLNTEARDNPLP